MQQCIKNLKNRLGAQVISLNNDLEIFPIHTYFWRESKSQKFGIWGALVSKRKSETKLMSDYNDPLSSSNFLGVQFGSNTLRTWTRSSVTAKSTASPWCLVGVSHTLRYFSGENLLMANQPLLRNWPRKLPNSAK